MRNNQFITTEYDAANPMSIYEYALQLKGHTFGEVGSWSANRLREDEIGYDNKKRKGGLGNFIEEQFFGYKANSDSNADFAEAGVELKVTPYEIKKNGKLSAGERLVLTMISYENAVEHDFFKSHVWDKCKLMLLIYYLRDKTLKSNMDYRIDFVNLFTPPEEDIPIILEDYRTIIDKVEAGKADELSESDTMYLGACTKGATAAKSTVPQAFYNPEVRARKRAFCFKNSYMTYLLNNYIVPGNETYESIIKSPEDLVNTNFCDYVVETINSYSGKTDQELCLLFERVYNNNKAQWSDLAYRMLGIKSNKAEEFQKANIVVKAIRIEENGKMKESSPLPNFKMKELVEQEWEDSTLYEYLEETKFLFVVFKKSGDNYVLKGAQIWNMSSQDLDNRVQQEWSAIRDIVKTGVELVPNGKVVKNNFPAKQDDGVIHIRPHAQKSFYVFEDGSTFGSGSLADADELPDGRFMTKQSFWLNNTYIMSQIKDDLKKNRQ